MSSIFAVEVVRRPKVKKQAMKKRKRIKLPEIEKLSKDEQWKKRDELLILATAELDRVCTHLLETAEQHCRFAESVLHVSQRLDDILEKQKKLRKKK